MPKELKFIPRFASEEEELAFWDEHDIAEFDDGPAEDIILDFKRPKPKQRINLRLDPDLIAELKDTAAEHGMPYQALARGLIRRGLSQLRQRA